MTVTLRQFDYLAPTSTAAAVQALSVPGSVALAGGHHLLTLLKRRELTVSRLVDLRGLDELRGVCSTTTGGLRIGASTTLAALLEDKQVQDAYGTSALHDAVAVMGDRQSRHRVTIGGQLACARAGNDLAAALLALGATVHLSGPAGDRTITLDDIWDGPRLLLRPGELITTVELDPPRGPSGYTRTVNRATLEAVCGVATVHDTSRSAQSFRVAAVGVWSRPTRHPHLETALHDHAPITATTVAPTHDGVLDDTLAGAAYRLHMTSILTTRATDLATSRTLPAAD